MADGADRDAGRTQLHAAGVGESGGQGLAVVGDGGAGEQAALLQALEDQDHGPPGDDVARASSELDSPGRWSSTSRQEYCGTVSSSGRNTVSIAARKAVAAFLSTYPSCQNADIQL